MEPAPKLIPKVIWILWLQGWESAPNIVKKCLESWQFQNPRWKINFLTSTNLENFIDKKIILDYHSKKIQPEAFSDILRILLLERYGGVWVDATAYCLKPLDEWIYEESDCLVAFRYPTPDRMVASWFLAASKDDYIVKSWSDEVKAYWNGRKVRDHYFWFHNLFERCYNSNQEFKKIWDSANKLPAKGTFRYFTFEKLNKTMRRRDYKFFCERPVPILKLTHKSFEKTYNNDSVLSYIYKSSF